MQGKGLQWGGAEVLLEDRVHGCDTSGHILFLPLAVSIAGPAFGDVIEKPLVLGVIESSGKTRRHALVSTQQSVGNR